MVKKRSEYFINKKDEILKEEILSERDYEFYLRIFHYHEEYSEKYSFKELRSFLDIKNFPALRPDAILFESDNHAVIMASLNSLSDIMKEFHSGFSMERFVERVQSESAPASLLRAFLSGDESYLASLADESRAGMDELIFITANWFKPYVIRMRKDFFSGADTDDWLGRMCPFCGQGPDMARIVEARDNIRYLHCSFCDEEWKFQRFGCVHCGNALPDKMGYYEYDGSLVRFDYCDACKGYIKTLKIPKTNREESFDLTVENIITNYLDASAIGMGYVKN